MTSSDMFRDISLYITVSYVSFIDPSFLSSSRVVSDIDMLVRMQYTQCM